MSTLADRIVSYSLVATTGLLVGAYVSWAVTALFVVLLVVLVWFSVEISRLEAERDKFAAHALMGLEPWQVRMFEAALAGDRMAGKQGTTPTFTTTDETTDWKNR